MGSVDHNVLDVGTEATVTDRSGETNQLIALSGTDRRATGDDRYNIVLRPLQPPSLLLVQRSTRA
jgi:hypothetical protein